jgi:SagB-type dehydrogenase family enzyme
MNRLTLTAVIWVAIVCLAAGGCDVKRTATPVFNVSSATPTATPMTTLASGEVPLPPPRTDGTASLEACLAGRRSVRAFTDQDLTWEQIGQLLWAAQGLTSDWGGRTAPSAGALYPLEVYVVTRQGVYRYAPQGHRLVALAMGDQRKSLQAASLNQGAVESAPAVFVVAGVYARTAARYGDRADRYVHLEAGHAAQNFLLQAVALDLAGVPMGAFDDAGVQHALGLPADHAPLYVIPVGYAR